tara:strand:- start:147 stop:1322 length:1176 start_codon:yes stop_codon:yes gene_type:complete
MSKLAIQLQQYLFILLGVFIPTSIAITNFIIVAISFCWLLEGNFKVKFELIKNSKWIMSIFALIFLYALGMFWGDVHLDAHWQFQRLALLLVFPVLFTIQLNQSTIRHGVSAFLITTFISACIAILINNNLLSPLSEYIVFINPDPYTSAFIKYNYHNVLLALSFGLCLYLIIEKKTEYKRVLVLFIIVYAVSIFTELGRAGQVLFNLISLFYIIYYSSKQIFKSVIFFILLLGFQFLVYQTTNAYKQRVQAVSHILQNNGEKPNKTKDIRYVFVEESLNKIFEKPFLGHGTGSFGATITKQLQGYDYHHKTPHNQYLYVWFELGVFGLFLLGRIFYYQILEMLTKKDRIHMVLLPLSFIFLMLIDSYLFIFLLTITYIYLYTVCSRYESE